MRDTERQFIKLLKSSIDQQGGNFSDNEEINWEDIYKLSTIHKLVPMIYESSYKLNEFKNIDKPLSECWKNLTLSITLNQIYKTHKFLDLYKEFNKNNIRVLVFKGIICREMYKNPDERISADEDILVKNEDVEICTEIILQSGFVKISESEDVDIFLCEKTGLAIEMHKSLFEKDEAIYEKLNDLFSNIFEDYIVENIQGVEVSTFSYEKHLMYLICHSGKHFLTGGFGIRQVCDFGLFIKTYGTKVNWSNIWSNLDEIGLLIFTLNLIDISKKYLGIDDSNIEYMDNLQDYYINSENLLEDIMDAGIYGSSSVSRKNTAIMTLDAVSGDKHSTKTSKLKAIFPKAEMISNQYPYVEKYKIMLPIAWTSRIIDYIKKKGNFTNLTGSINETIDLGSKRIELMKEYKMMK